MSVQPAIFIDQKKYRIRIYKRTIHLLGDPKFIQLLINPVELIIAIRAADDHDSVTHRIVWKNIISNQCYELNSRFLIQQMQTVCDNWKIGQCYRLLGEMAPDKNIALFNLQNVIPYVKDREAQYE